MRALVILLLVANVAFLGWRYVAQQEDEERQRRAHPPITPETPRLQLVPGVAPVTAATTPESIDLPINPEAPPVASGVCVQAGPFAARAAADPLIEWFATRSVRVQVKEERLPAVRRHALYLVPAETKGEWLLIGVLDSQAEAATRAREVSQPGFSPLIVPRTDQPVRWTVISELASGFEDVGEVPSALVPDGRIEQVACTP